ncbi:MULTISPECIES: contractile injection system protein, VgrG/Pvc8 family [unclassified Sphingobium]|uniref:contractile injection system protein, VgrG/Pvc8 family n=1 Tax=unclassified Sphingobium TaxID=2611147 RepID=UPI0022251E09|nr:MULTISPECIES: contractile injection system protein, VgrG/Pvc8 family [unclassified Sphingobium]MCW2410862.1 phage protein D [Sphingobium sp. B8D3D]MCW2416848.1 phage protein D [Sphingobium sp. B8D3A]
MSGHNIADWRVTLDGVDLSDRLRPRLVSLSLSERRDDEADQLDIVLSDTDGGLAIPREGAVLSVEIGWKQGRNVPIGLVHKGSFKVDDVTHAGPPDQITIRARSADFTSEIRNRREGSWKDTTLGAILRDVAGRNGLTAKVAPDLSSIALASIAQSRESDVAFLRRLGREHDAVSTIKSGNLIFARKGAGATTSGKALPQIEIPRSHVSSHSWQRQKREGQEGVAASWHDRGEAKRKSVTVGAQKDAKRLRKVYPDEASATQAAIAERDRLKRAPATLDLTLALGRPDATPEAGFTVSGFKDEIDATRWLITEVTHRLDKSGGYTSALRAECMP